MYRPFPILLGIEDVACGRRGTIRVLGLDLGASKVAVRLDGPVARATRFQWPLDGGSAADLQTLTAQLRDLLVSEGGPLDAAGVATPCTLDPSGVVIAWPSRPSWVGVDLRGALEPLLGPRLRFGDDGDLAAAAEAAEAGAAVLVYLGVGTGIGGGVVLGGRRHPGSLGAAGEIGHVMVRRGGPARGVRAGPGAGRAVGAGGAAPHRGGPGLGGRDRRRAPAARPHPHRRRLRHRRAADGADGARGGRRAGAARPTRPDPATGRFRRHVLSGRRGAARPRRRPRTGGSCMTTPKHANDDFPAWPQFGDEERAGLWSTLDQGQWWRVAGAEVDAFERELAAYHGAARALAVTNGTHALELGLELLGVGPGDEVIVPGFTFISSSLAVQRRGAVPVPVEVTLDTYCIDLDATAAAVTPRTRAIMPV